MSDAAARIRAYLDACPEANGFGREIRWELRDADGQPYDLPRVDLIEVLDILAAARNRHRAYPTAANPHAYCLSCRTGKKEPASNFPAYVKWPCPEAVALGLAEGGAQ
jgi:hypothetical protein